MKPVFSPPDPSGRPLPRPPLAGRLLLLLNIIFPPAVVVAPWFAPRVWPLSQQVSRLLMLWATLILVAAATAPQPALALLGAGVKIVAVAALMLIGTRLTQWRWTQLLIPGSVFILLTALAFGFLENGYLPFLDRLSHPYYTTVSLGIIGAISLWVATLMPGLSLPTRVIGGFTGVLLLGLSGSRGPLLAALLGFIAAGLHPLLKGRRRTTWLPLVAAFLVIATSTALVSGFLSSRTSFSAHLTSFDANGRDVVWFDTLSAVAQHPWSGYGPFLLGREIAPLTTNCAWYPSLEAAGYPCPAWVSGLNSTWIIAHNNLLQLWGESGLLGMLASVLLYGLILSAVWRRGQRLDIAIVVGLLSADLTDNVTIVPSMFFAALPWVLGGAALVTDRNTGRQIQPALWTAFGLLCFWGAPLWVGAVTQREHHLPVTIEQVLASPIWQGNDPYPVFLRASAPDGSYRVQLRFCQPRGNGCHTALIGEATASGGSLNTTLTLPLQGRGPWQVQALIRPAEITPWHMQPLGAAHWSLRRGQP